MYGSEEHLFHHSCFRLVMNILYGSCAYYINKLHSSGDAIILNCQAEGTPTPEILWYKDANPVEPSGTVGIFNDGTELRISNIRHEDIGDYTCIARNGEGQVSHTARVIVAGGAVITVC